MPFKQIKSIEFADWVTYWTLFKIKNKNETFVSNTSIHFNNIYKYFKLFNIEKFYTMLLKPFEFKFPKKQHTSLFRVILFVSMNEVLYILMISLVFRFVFVLFYFGTSVWFFMSTWRFDKQFPTQFNRFNYIFLDTFKMLQFSTFLSKASYKRK